MSSFELSEREERFCEWLACPKGQRRPATLVLLAEELGVHVSQLYRWRRRPNVRDRVMDLVEDAVGGFERVQDILNKVYEDGMTGNSKAQEMFLKYAGVLVDRKDSTVKIHESSDTSDRSVEELERELEELRRANSRT